MLCNMTMKWLRWKPNSRWCLTDNRISYPPPHVPRLYSLLSTSHDSPSPRCVPRRQLLWLCIHDNQAEAQMRGKCAVCLLEWRMTSDSRVDKGQQPLRRERWSNAMRLKQKNAVTFFYWWAPWKGLDSGFGINGTALLLTAQWAQSWKNSRSITEFHWRTLRNSTVDQVSIWTEQRWLGFFSPENQTMTWVKSLWFSQRKKKTLTLMVIMIGNDLFCFLLLRINWL